MAKRRGSLGSPRHTERTGKSPGRGAPVVAQASSGPLARSVAPHNQGSVPASAGYKPRGMSVYREE